MSDEDLGIGSRIKHPQFGIGVIINAKAKTYTVVFTEKGRVEVSRSYNAIEVIEAAEPDTDLISLSDIERSLTSILKKYSDVTEVVPLGDRWVGGKLVLYPANDGLQPKEIPIDVQACNMRRQ